MGICLVCDTGPRAPALDQLIYLFIHLTGHYITMSRLLLQVCTPVLDSNLRFLGGIWLGIGLAMLWLVPSIEQQETLFRALWIAVFLGGVGRVLSWMLIGPLFIYWQYRVAQTP
jgi:hypothetical protein